MTHKIFYHDDAFFVLSTTCTAQELSAIIRSGIIDEGMPTESLLNILNTIGHKSKILADSEDMTEFWI